MNSQSMLLFLLLVGAVGGTYWSLMTGAFQQLHWTTDVVTLVISFFVMVAVLFVFLR